MDFQTDYPVLEIFGRKNAFILVYLIESSFLGDIVERMFGTPILACRTHRALLHGLAYTISVVSTLDDPITTLLIHKLTLSCVYTHIRPTKISTDVPFADARSILSQFLTHLIVIKISRRNVINHANCVQEGGYVIIYKQTCKGLGPLRVSSEGGPWVTSLTLKNSLPTERRASLTTSMSLGLRSKHQYL